MLRANLAWWFGRLWALVRQGLVHLGPAGLGWVAAGVAAFWPAELQKFGADWSWDAATWQVWVFGTSGTLSVLSGLFVLATAANMTLGGVRRSHRASRLALSGYLRNRGKAPLDRCTLKEACRLGDELCAAFVAHVALITSLREEALWADLMVFVPTKTQRSSLVRQLVASMGVQEIDNPYRNRQNPNLAGWDKLTDSAASGFLILACRSRTTTPPIYLRVHPSETSALPGAQRAAATALSRNGPPPLEPAHDAIDNTRKLKKHTRGDLSKNELRELQGYFARDVPHIRSFVSIAILDDSDDLVGVLNIDWGKTNLFKPRTRQHLVLAAAEPMLPLMASAARAILRASDADSGHHQSQPCARDSDRAREPGGDQGGAGNPGGGAGNPGTDVSVGS